MLTASARTLPAMIVRFPAGEVRAAVRRPLCTRSVNCPFRLQYDVSMTGEDSGGLVKTPEESIGACNHLPINGL